MIFLHITLTGLACSWLEIAANKRLAWLDRALALAAALGAGVGVAVIW